MHLWKGIHNFSFSTFIIFWKGYFPEGTHGLFTFNAAPFNSLYFLSLLAVHELHSQNL